MVGISAFLGRRPFVFALVFSTIPYVGLRFYVDRVMHAAAAPAEAPGAGFLAALLVLGAAVPGVFIAVVLKRLVAEKDVFELRALLEIYFAALLVFAVTYAVLQSSSASPAFLGMPVLWDGGAIDSAATHVARLHGVFGNAMYLSVVTMTTVGFGDVVPVGFIAKTLTALQGLLGIGFVGLVLGQYFSSCLACSGRGE